MRTPRAGAPGRCTARSDFAKLRRARRKNSQHLWVRFAPESTDGVTGQPVVGVSPVRVAFALGRHVGGAVTRNRIRRRLRAALAELTAGLAPGCYLIGATERVATLGFGQLVDELAGVLGRAAVVGKGVRP